jgi:hemoglobin/transferrin/lactoferrin receptor protein
MTSAALPLCPSLPPARLKLRPLCLALLAAAPLSVLAQASWAVDDPSLLVAAAGELPQVVVTGSRGERRLDEVPATIDLIQGEDLDPARVQDIRDLARDLPNVSVRRAPQRFGAVMGSTGRDGNAGFNIRGLEGNRVLLSVDGVRMPRALSSGVFGSAAFGRDYYDLGLISRVEILRGANSALYGSDGLAGMVAMFTTEPKDLLSDGKAFGGRAGVRYDGEARGLGAGVTLAGAASDSLQWLASVQAGRARELDNMGEVDTANSTRTRPNPQRDRELSVLGKAVLTPGGGQRHTLTVERVQKDSEVEVLSGRSPTPTGTLDLDGTADMTRTRLSWDGQWKLGVPWADELRAVLAWQGADGREVSTERRTATPNLRERDVAYKERLWQAVIQAERSGQLSDGVASQWIYGLDLTRTAFDNLVTGIAPPAYESYPLKRFPPTTETTAAVFAQAEFVSEKWSVIPALRYDHFRLSPNTDALYPLDSTSLSDGALSPKLGVIFRPVEGWSVFGNLASGFRAPAANQVNLYFDNPTGFQPYRAIPNPDLRPERSRTAELGVRGERGGATWEVVAFAGRYKDFIDDLVNVGGSGTAASPTLFQSVNRSRVNLSGFEFKGKLPLASGTNLRFAFGQTRGRDTVTGQPLNSVNPAQLMLGIDHRVGAWTFGATAIHVARKSADDINTVPEAGGTAGQFATPAYTTLDLNATWRIRPDLRLSGTIRNLTDRKHWEWTNVRGVAASSTVLDAFTSPGRSLSVALVKDF